MKVHLLGSGGAWTNARRGNTSLALSARTALLIECSGNPCQLLQRAGVDPVALTDILLSHEHPDHLYGLPSLVLQLYLANLETRSHEPLLIRGPETALDVARALLTTTSLLDLDDSREIRFVPLPLEQHTLELDGLRVMTFPVCHKDHPTLGIKAIPTETPDRSIVFSGDTTLCDDLIDQSNGASLLFHECSSFSEEVLDGHTTLHQVQELAERSTAQRIVLVHLPPTTPKGEGRIRRELKKRFGPRVVLGEDGISWDL